VGFIMPELLESNVTLVVVDEKSPKTMTVPRHTMTTSTPWDVRRIVKKTQGGSDEASNLPNAPYQLP